MESVFFSSKKIAAHIIVAADCRARRRANGRTDLVRYDVHRAPDAVETDGIECVNDNACACVCVFANGEPGGAQFAALARGDCDRDRASRKREHKFTRFPACMMVESDPIRLVRPSAVIITHQKGGSDKTSY